MGFDEDDDWIFVANPDKTSEVELILRNNRDLLIDFLISFLPEKGMNVVDLSF